MKKNIFFIFLFFTFNLLLFTFPVRAAEVVDTDEDGLPDEWEINVFHTNPNLADTDGDGYSDWQEIESGFDPLQKGNVKLKETDYDRDDLSDRLELLFGTDPTNPDTDGDSHSDGAEVKAAYDPASSSPVKLKKQIEVNLAKQELTYYLGKIQLGKYPTSTGTKAHPTPKGTYVIANKNLKAWSNSAKLWMPYWLGLKGTKFGIHELPYWPNGVREGEQDLGKPASGGCIRLGRHGEAKTLYDWAEVGTQVIVR
ncbi:MAG TPA: L,D-transpeptidase family protein [Candidatus Methylomirabilis sp.]|nr:L,D-transpeptidase family protein [Candidatus Methylomirabilis sp.]